MQTITSLQNPIVKLATSLHQRKSREETGLFLIEGKKGVEEAINYGLEITQVFTKENSNEKILKKISTTDTPPEIVAIAKQFKYDIKDLFKDETPLIIVLENIKDPGNLGTIIRTAKAASASGIILTGDTADIFNPKTVRSSAGNLWKIPIIKLEEKNRLKEIINSNKPCQIIGTKVDKNSEKVYFKVDYKKPTVVVFGSEAEGISDQLAQQCDFLIQIPMHSEIESLNLSVSVGIILYEALRQKLS
ncbi:MAG: hypothetical protein A2Y25_05490 [Candidatus Melainabacteria bacterium GWF2_37_15]|nr:MAG: hypothetical protein A2Y25_05490 [Candidatus Melainabacteria bacterium GWF2_37_15]